MTSYRNHPQIEMVAPSTLTVGPTHARKHGKKQVEQIARAMDRFGCVVPIVADDDGVIAAGVGRLKAALLRGLELVPVIRVKFVSEADRRAFALADNKIAEAGEWDEAQLKGELEYLFEQDYDLGLTGFSLDDLDLGVIPADAPEPPVELPDPAATAVTRPGDLWLIGPHRLYCGNARETVSYEALLGEERAAMVLSDPPYNVRIDGHVSGLGEVRHREFAEAAGEMSVPEFTSFLRSAFRLCARFTTDGSIHYHCMDWRHIREMLDAADGVYTEFKQLIAWVKSNAGMGIRLARLHKASTLLIENAASGQQLIQTLRSEQHTQVPLPVACKPEGDKLSRALGATGQIAGGQLLLPRDAPWLVEFEAELLAFPSGRHDDQVDALTQLMSWVLRDSSIHEVSFAAPILFEPGEDGRMRSSRDADWVSYPYSHDWDDWL